MKSVLSALDLHYLIEEWKLLINAKLDKVFSNKEVFLFQFHAPLCAKLRSVVNDAGERWGNEHFYS